MYDDMPQTDPLPEWPPVPPGVARKVFCLALPPEVVALFAERGYTVVHINTLPRNTEQDNKAYLLAKAQGMDEGTIPSNEAARKVLELELKAYGLLDKRSYALNLNAEISKDDLHSVLGWAGSRHTLANNSTVVAAQTLKVASPQKKD